MTNVYTPERQAVEFARTSNAVEFDNTVRDLVKTQIADKINTLKTDLVKSFTFK